jgi:hypothetical protein
MHKLIIFPINYLLMSIMSIEATVAQTVELRENEIKKIEKYFNDNTPWEKLKDTSQLYAFAFKVNVSKIAKNKIKVSSIESNDSIAYKLYPGYLFLKSINYSPFMDDRASCSFIFPVILDVWNEKWPEKRAPRYDEVVAAAFYLTDQPLDMEQRVYFKPHMLRLDLGTRY